MADKRNAITIMIVKDTEAAPKSIKVSTTVYRLALIGAILFALVFIVETATYASLLAHSRERSELLSENAALKSSLEKLEQLEQELMKNRIMLRKMTELAGIDLGGFSIGETRELASSDGVTLVEPQMQLASPDSEPHPIPAGYPVMGVVSRSFRPQHENPRMRHTGIDIAIGEGAPVVATADGRVSLADWDSTFGWTIVIDHGAGLATMYGHNDSLLVRAGDEVRFGERIALSGNTGVSSAPHLHYEVRRDGQAVDPADYLEIPE
jgi:murein DD-endopeptidase MepM/ murein hydrolase activator NlpD